MSGGSPAPDAEADFGEAAEEATPPEGLDRFATNLHRFGTSWRRNGLHLAEVKTKIRKFGRKCAVGAKERKEQDKPLWSLGVRPRAAAGIDAANATSAFRYAAHNAGVPWKKLHTYRFHGDAEDPLRSCLLLGGRGAGC